MPMPFLDKVFTFTQPDGSRIQLRGTGNQYRAAFKTLDGFAAVRDPLTNVFHYPVAEGEALPARPAERGVGVADPRALGLTPSTRALPMRAPAMTGSGLQPATSRWEIRRQRRRLNAFAAGPGGIAAAPPHRQTLGTYVGLCLPIQFPDVSGAIAVDEIERFCNQRGYGGFGNNGSVCDYYHDMSEGKMTYTNIVAPYYTAKHNRSYYTDRSVAWPQRAIELVEEALSYHRASGFSFAGLSSDDGGYIYAINAFYAGALENQWGEGLWPHQYHFDTEVPLAPGKKAFDYQITDMDNELSLATFCHENGHMVCDFPDLYDTKDPSSWGAGYYCLMAYGGTMDAKNPAKICAYLKNAAGWTSAMTVLKADNSTVTLDSGSNQFAIQRKNDREYFILENRHRSGRDAALPNSGLAIWHVDENGSNDNQEMTLASHYECALLQADGRTDLEDNAPNGGGDATDLFRAGNNDRFDYATNPAKKWWDGSKAAGAIADIGPAGVSISFTMRP